MGVGAADPAQIVVAGPPTPPLVSPQHLRLLKKMLQGTEFLGPGGQEAKAATIISKDHPKCPTAVFGVHE